jgi:hypothetical protein
MRYRFIAMVRRDSGSSACSAADPPAVLLDRCPLLEHDRG